jgi:hypothetical protein
MAEQSALQSSRTSGRASAATAPASERAKQPNACADNLARLLEEMSKHPKQFNKYVTQLLVQYIELTEVHPLSPATKQALLPGIYALLDICSEFEYAPPPPLRSPPPNMILCSLVRRFKVVSRLVDETGRAIFKKLFEEYNRDWKFQGKV